MSRPMTRTTLPRLAVLALAAAAIAPATARAQEADPGCVAGPAGTPRATKDAPAP